MLTRSKNKRIGAHHPPNEVAPSGSEATAVVVDEAAVADVLAEAIGEDAVLEINAEVISDHGAGQATIIKDHKAKSHVLTRAKKKFEDLASQKDQEKARHRKSRFFASGFRR